MSDHNPPPQQRHLFLGGPRGNARFELQPQPARTFTAATASANPLQAQPKELQRPLHAKFNGGPRHGQRHIISDDPPVMITLPTPEGTHAYEKSSFDPLALTVTYKYIGILNGSDAPDEVEMQLASALASIAEHIKKRTALSPSSIMLPEHVFPDATKVLGLEIVRGERVALLLELM